MPHLINRLAFIKMRRILEFLIFIVFVIIVLTIGSKWSSSIETDNYHHVKIQVNPFLPNDQFVNNDNNNNNNRMIVNNDNNNNNRMMIEKSINGRPDLPKYIHLDLKGAPPQATKFYERFFSFIDKLQMGVKGVLIEYEDMLPLEGRFVNVSKK
jgi:hypothetical protein